MSWAVLDDIEKFLTDLVLGDFQEEQRVSVQVVSGVIQLVPILGQVMGARDVAGSLFLIHRKGGIERVGLEEKINLCFAVIGAVPEVGDVFKTVFKPLWKERKLSKTLVNTGVDMLERMRGMGKGGAVRWIRTFNWTSRTAQAIAIANQLLANCIQMLDMLAAGEWWIPEKLQNLARDLSPQLRSMQGKLDEPIRQGVGAIKEFLADMLGEDAAAVVIAVGEAAVLNAPRAGSHGGHEPGVSAASRRLPHEEPHPNAGHPTGSTSAAHTSEASATHPDTHTQATKGQQPEKTHKDVQQDPRVNGKPNAGRTASAYQRTAQKLKNISLNAASGLIGEHMVDYHCIEKMGWGLTWNTHDCIQNESGWKGMAQGSYGVPRKINDGERPVYLCTPSATVFRNGIDSAFLTNRMIGQQYAIVEAKARVFYSGDLYGLLSDAGSDGGSTSQRGGGKKGKSGSSSTKNAAAAKRSTGRTMQMSHEWIVARIEKDIPREHWRNIRGIGMGRVNYTRHVMLVTSVQAVQHLDALGEILVNQMVNDPTNAQRYAPEHADHEVYKKYGDADLTVAEATYVERGGTAKKMKRSAKPVATN
ncbi:hypothetical protein [Paraburkholderia tropica]|uniref:hypothetical protein n=2 Tax=Paraburkholderia tropica TaxID=92647 RepID=UPI002AAF7394|nr:hypothetical protein [Paraburkholderia tropica]